MNSTSEYSYPHHQMIEEMANLVSLDMLYERIPEYLKRIGLSWSAVLLKTDNGLGQIRKVSHDFKQAEITQFIQSGQVQFMFEGSFFDIHSQMWSHIYDEGAILITDNIRDICAIPGSYRVSMQNCLRDYLSGIPYKDGLTVETREAIMNEADKTQIMVHPFRTEGRILGALLIAGDLNHPITIRQIELFQSLCLLVSATCANILERQCLEITNQKLQHELKTRKIFEIILYQSEENYRKLSESSFDLIFRIDRDNILTFVSPTITRTLGYRVDQAVGQDFLHFVVQSDQEKARLLHHKLFQGESFQNIRFNIINVKSKEVPIEVNCYPIYCDQHVVAVQGIARDISEQLHLERLTRQHQQQLIQNEKMVSLGLLSSGIAHEINNPNQYIMANLGILSHMFRDIQPILAKYYRENGDFKMGGLSYEEIKDKIPDLFEWVLKGAERIKTMVTELKSYSRTNDDALDGLININDVIRSAVTLTSNYIKKATRHFQVEYNHDLPLVRGNYQKLEQVIINLLRNACEALRSPEDRLEVQSCYDHQDAKVVIMIRDTGVGMDQSLLSRITEPFYTTKRESGGTGLGLTISKNIVLQHAGRLEFDSCPEMGTTASLILPSLDRSYENQDET
ncbi:PAS domain S-box protein [bacterium]|nr:PAS domain S-box protein [bacterium]